MSDTQMYKNFTIYNNNENIDLIIENEEDADLLARELAKYIQSHYEKSIIYNMLGELNYGNFNSICFSTIYNRLLDNPINKRLDILYGILKEYVSEEKILNMNGFVIFRLAEYKDELKSLLKKTVDSMVAENDYNEFIELLRFFVEIQESEIECIHVIYSCGRYILFDENYNEITEEYISGIKNEIKYGTINYDDLLLSTLISLAPKKIYIHGKDNIINKQLLKTIRCVFDERVEYIEGINLSQIKGNL